MTAKEMRLLPVYVYGSEALKHQAQIKRSKGIMLHSQLSLCRSGCGEFTDHNNITHQVKKDDVMYFTSAAPNSYRPLTSPWSVDYIVMGGHGLMPLMESLNFSKSGVITPTASSRSAVKDLFELIIQKNNLWDENTHSECSRYLYQLIFELSHSVDIRYDDSLIKKTELLSPCINYIKSNYMDDISIAELAEMLGVTPTYLGILFKEVYRITPQKYLINMRIDCSKRLLILRKDMKLSEIASLSGFNSTSYFCNTFRKYIGITPDEYRRANTYTDL